MVNTSESEVVAPFDSVHVSAESKIPMQAKSLNFITFALNAPAILTVKKKKRENLNTKIRTGKREDGEKCC